MKVEIITIGDEILIGQTVDSNSAWIASELNQIGIKVNRIVSIADKREEILQALTDASQRAKVVLITGGLGPTKDDITKQTLCEYFDTKLALDEKVLENVETIILGLTGKMNELNRKQAEVPQACTVINNPVGTAPIMWFEKDGTIYVSMPGVPHEMQYCMLSEIIPRLKRKFETPVIYHKTILTTGIGESFLAEQIEKWETELPDFMQLAYLPSPGIVKLRLTCIGESLEVIHEEAEEQVTKLKTVIPEAIFGYDNDTIESVVGDLLRKSNKTVSSAESCTGGNIAHLITSVPGSSEYYPGSVVAYSNDIKEKVLGVLPEILKDHGAVSREVVVSMSHGVRKSLGTDYGLATSGIAGPGGARPDKPVGTVWIAATSGKTAFAKKYNFGTNRELNIQKASITALNLLRLLIEWENA